MQISILVSYTTEAFLDPHIFFNLSVVNLKNLRLYLRDLKRFLLLIFIILYILCFESKCVQKLIPA